jgi:topoisomerase-4 subunit A
MREIVTDGELEVSDALPNFYVPYASYVIQTRALPDARDGLKTGARFILYAQYKNKNTFKNKRRKATATKSAAMMFSPHGK